MNRFYIFFLILPFLFCACEDKKDDIVSLGAEMDMEEIHRINNLDKASYAELEGIVKDNSVIDPDGKYLMIIFGANGCIYCDQLKNTIKNSAPIQAKLKQNFSPYYINFSYIKPHQFVTSLTQRPIVTTDLVKIYRVGPTPMIIFANKDSKTILTHTGAMGESQLLAALDFITSKVWLDSKDEKEINAKYKAFLQEHL